MKQYIKSLEGITYSQWIKVRFAVDKSFDRKIGELKKDLELSDTKNVEEIIHQQFG